MATLLFVGFGEYGRRTDRFIAFTRRTHRRLEWAIELHMPPAETKEHPPFNPSLFTVDSHGKPQRYLNSPNDEAYLVSPPEWVPRGMLPPEELEIRYLLLRLAVVRRNIAADKNRNEEGAANAVRQMRSEIAHAANRTWARKCAVWRIASTMSVDGQERLELLGYLDT